MNNTADRYLRTKKLFAMIMGYLVLLVSFQFSANGFGFRTDDSRLVGYILAFAVTAGQLIFNTQVKKLNWTIVVIGILSYIYSIWTNILGFYIYRGELDIVFDLSFRSIVPIFGGAFMDIFPEMALAWAYGAGSDGDLIGNLTKLGEVDKPTISTRVIPEHYNLPKRQEEIPFRKEVDIPDFMKRPYIPPVNKGKGR